MKIHVSSVNSCRVDIRLRPAGSLLIKVTDAAPAGAVNWTANTAARTLERNRQRRRMALRTRLLKGSHDPQRASRSFT